MGQNVRYLKHKGTLQSKNIEILGASDPDSDSVHFLQRRNTHFDPRVRETRVNFILQTAGDDQNSFIAWRDQGNIRLNEVHIQHHWQLQGGGGICQIHQPERGFKMLQSVEWVCDFRVCADRCIHFIVDILLLEIVVSSFIL